MTTKHAYNRFDQIIHEECRNAWADVHAAQWNAPRIQVLEVA
ncbi:hypothetical protein [Aeromonas hydrophila]